MMEEKLKAMVDSLKKGLDSKVENDIKISKEEEKQINEERDKKIEEANKQIEAANKMIEEANKEAEEKRAEVHNKVLLKYENIFKEMNGGIVQQEQPLENFDIPNMEEKKEEVVEETKAIDSSNISDPFLSADFVNGTSEVESHFEPEKTDTEEKKETDPLIFDQNASIPLGFDADIKTPEIEDATQIETSEPIQVTAVEDGADVIAQLGNVEQEVTQEAAPQIEEPTQEVVPQVEEAAPQVEAPVKEFAPQVVESVPQVEEVAPQVEVPVQEQPVSNMEKSSGFTEIVDSMDQGRARGLHPAN